MEGISRKVVTVFVFVGLGFAGTSAYASPDINSAVITTRIWNDCPDSVVTYGNDYPTSLWIMDEELGCPTGWANRHNFRLSENGITPAVFMNDDAFDLSADVTLTGPANSEGGLNIAPWWSQEVDGVLTAITGNGEIAAFGGRLPFYSFNMHDPPITYTKGETIRLAVRYRPNSLTEEDPATIEYLVTKEGITYSSGVLPFDQGNPAEDPPYGLWGMLNDARVGGYFMPQNNPADPDNWGRADFDNIVYDPNPQVSPDIDSAVITTRIWNDCPDSVLTYGNEYPTWLWIMDEELGCPTGWANRHNFRLSENGITAAVFMNDDVFDLFADVTLTGPANSEGGLNIAPWWSKEVDGVLAAITWNGEIAAFGGRLPFYSFFMQDPPITYTKGETIRLGAKYRPNSLTEEDPATIEYLVIKNGITYSSGVLPFDQGNPAEDPPYGLWGMLNDARVGGYFMPQNNPADPDNWGRVDFKNISYDPDPPISLDLDIKPGSCPNSFNRGSHGVLPVGLLGTEDFNVATINTSTVVLSRGDGVAGQVAPHEGPPGPHSVFDDVGTPFDGDGCGCHEYEGDGIDDLSMKFRTDAVVAALELDDLPAGALVELVVSGSLYDGTAFVASDCIRLVPPGTAGALLAVESSVASAWIGVDPLDETLDGGGFADFVRTMPLTTVVTLTAEEWAEGRPLRGWQIGGLLHHMGQTSVEFVIARDMTVRAVYGPTPGGGSPKPDPTAPESFIQEETAEAGTISRR